MGTSHCPKAEESGFLIFKNGRRLGRETEGRSGERKREREVGREGERRERSLLLSFLLSLGPEPIECFSPT